MGLFDDDTGAEASLWDDVTDAVGGTVDAASDAIGEASDAADEAWDNIEAAADEAWNDAAASVDETVDAASAAADEAWNEAAAYVEEYGDDAAVAITQATGGRIDLDDSDGKVGVDISTKWVKVQATSEDGKGFTASGEVELDVAGGKYGGKANIGLDEDGELTAIGGGAKAYVPVEGIPLGGEVEGGYAETADGYKVTGSVSTGGVYEGAELKQGVHFGYEDKGGDDFAVNVGSHASVGVEHDASGAKAEMKVSNDFIYGEDDGNTTYGIRASITGEASLQGEKLAEAKIEGGAAYVTGVDGDRYVVDGSYGVTAGNQRIGTTAGVNEGFRYETGVDGQGDEVDRLTTTSSAFAKSTDLGIDVSVSEQETYDDVAAQLGLAGPAPAAPLAGVQAVEPAAPDPLAFDPGAAETPAATAVAEPLAPEAGLAEPILAAEAQARPGAPPDTGSEATPGAPLEADAVAGPATTSMAGETFMAEPEPMEPLAPQTALAEPAVAGTVAPPHAATEPALAEPVAIEPVFAEPVAVEPAASEPVLAEPVSVSPALAEPLVADATAAEALPVEPVAPEPIAPVEPAAPSLQETVEEIDASVDDLML